MIGMTSTRTKTLLLVCALALAFAVAAPTASAERVTGCLDGWDAGDSDCALGDVGRVWPPYDCVQDCDGPPDS